MTDWLKDRTLILLAILLGGFQCSAATGSDILLDDGYLFDYGDMVLGTVGGERVWGTDLGTFYYGHGRRAGEDRLREWPERTDSGSVAFVIDGKWVICFYRGLTVICN